MDIKVTRIGKRWHARLMEAGIVLDEMACVVKEDIGWICREMLRWQDKCGNGNEWTASARVRHNGERRNDIVFYHQELKKKKDKIYE